MPEKSHKLAKKCNNKKNAKKRQKVQKNNKKAGLHSKAATIDSRRESRCRCHDFWITNKNYQCFYELEVDPNSLIQKKNLT